MGEDEFDFGSLFGGGDTDMSNFDMGGFNLDELALSDLGNFDIGDLGNMDFGGLDLSGIDLGNMDLGNLGDQGIDINSILEGLQTDREGGQNLDLESFLKDIGGDKSLTRSLSDATPIARQELNIAPGDYAPLEDQLAELMGTGSTKTENLGMGDMAENAGGAYDQDYSNINALEALMGKDLSNPDEADISNLGMGNLATNVGGAYDPSYNPDAPLKSTRSKNEAIASGTSPGSAGAKALAENASQFTPAETAALTGNKFTNTSTGKSLNEAIASGMSPGSIGAKAAAAGELDPEELAAAQGVVTKGSVYNPITSAEKTAAALKSAADAKAALTKATPAAKDGSNNMSQMMMLLALMALMNKDGGSKSSGATIPSLSADRKQLPYGGGSSYRPGQGGVSYFTPTTYTTKAAGGGLMSLNGGGHLGGYSDGGRLLRGPGDGVSDSIPATIGGKQPARLATGEFVVPARIVSELGNGSTDSGAQRLYEMMDRVQHARRKTKNVAANTKAAKYLPA